MLIGATKRLNANLPAAYFGVPMRMWSRSVSKSRSDPNGEDTASPAEAPRPDRQHGWHEIEGTISCFTAR
jgi:hypothetical protein